MRNVNVALWGFGAMASGIAKVLLEKEGVTVIGACDIDPRKIGKSIYELLGVEQGDRPDAFITDDISTLIDKEKCDICVIATDSFTKKVYPKVCYVVERGVNVITTAEEMSYPMAQDPELSDAMDILAKTNNVSILGTGINPGLMMDLLAVCLSGCMTHLDKVTCKRVNSLSPFGKLVMEEQGIGLTVDEFNQRVADGTMAGHVGFAQSVGMIAEAVGWKVDKFEQQMSPIVTDVDRQAPHGFAKAGDVAGVNMTGQGYVDGQVKIDMIHPQQIEPQLGGVQTGDYIVLEGSPAVHMANTPEVDGGIGTIGMTVNMLPFVVAAKPGLHTMLTMPVPRCVMGNFAKIAFEEE